MRMCLGRIIQKTLSALPATIFVALLPFAALAEKRAAFIVGNAAYSDAAVLKNPGNDAGLMASTLGNLGFAVDLQVNLTRADFSRAFSSFLRTHDGADVMLFYYAGHGIQFEDRNYLLGTDAELVSEFDIAGETIALDTVVQALERRSKAALVFIDACRDNPIADAFYAENFPGTRSVAARGLAEMREAYEGTMVVFAASPGQVAFDGTGPNSPFTLALARHLPAENVEVLSLMKRVIRDTRLLTRGQQSPVVTNDLAKDIFLQTGATLALSPEDLAAAEWPDFRDSISETALRSFADRHPGTAFAALALERIQRLPPISPDEQDASRSQFTGIRPEWCVEPSLPSQRAICENSELLGYDRRVSALYQQRLDTSKGGVAFEVLLIEHADWQETRDRCGADFDCLAASYLVRLAALSGADSNLLPAQQVVYAIQSELNRLSCGAGRPDGRAGPRTRAALNLARDQLPTNTLLPASTLQFDDQIALIEMLGDLRKQPTGLCSMLTRAADDPVRLTGRWSVTSTCGPRSSLGVGQFARVLEISYRGTEDFEAVVATPQGAQEEFLARLENGVLSLLETDTNGVDGRRLRSWSLVPGAAPLELRGRDHLGCDVIATR